MKFLISILVTALLAFACGLYLPWWSIALVAFVVGLSIELRPLYSFFAGCAGILLLWLLLILVINSANDGILASKVSQVLGLGSSPVLLIVVNCVIGSLVGGMGALTGSLLRRVKR